MKYIKKNNNIEIKGDVCDGGVGFFIVVLFLISESAVERITVLSLKFHHSS